MMRKLSYASAVVLALALAGAVPAQAEPLEKMARKMEKALKGKENRKVAVLAFPYHDGRSSSGSTLVQERLTTYLAAGGKVQVIERNLLNKVLDEMKLENTGLIDKDTTHKLGKVLGVACIVTGTLYDLGAEKTEVNARLISTESGEILTAGLTKIARTWKDDPVRPGGATALVTDPPKPTPPPAGGPAKDKPLVQLAILLDTSNSMDGLIEQAKSQLWKIVNELASAEKGGQAPALQVSLYEYGNNSLSAQGNYVRRVLPFSTDLDKVSEGIFGLKTNGGSEYAGAAIQDAVSGLDWSPQAGVYKALFVAGNESFNQGPLDFREAVASAKARSIFVNTIYCGSRQQGVGELWKDGADLGGGEYLNIDQDRVVTAMRAPQDDEIERLGRELNQTYVAYGAAGKDAALRQEMEDKKANAPSMAVRGASVQRAMFKAKEQYASAAAEWDMAAAVESGKLSADKLEEGSLPAELKGKSSEERKRFLEEKIAQRKALQERIQKLGGERQRHVAQEEKRAAASGAATLDTAVLGAVRRQAATKSYKFGE